MCFLQLHEACAARREVEVKGLPTPKLPVGLQPVGPSRGKAESTKKNATENEGTAKTKKGTTRCRTATQGEAVNGYAYVGPPPPSNPVVAMQTSDPETSMSTPTRKRFDNSVDNLERIST